MDCGAQGKGVRMNGWGGWGGAAFVGRGVGNLGGGRVMQLQGGPGEGGRIVEAEPRLTCPSHSIAS